MRAVAVGSGLLALVGWSSALVGFLVYVNWSSETGRMGGSFVLALAWLGVLVGLGGILAFLTAAACGRRSAGDRA